MQLDELNLALQLYSEKAAAQWQDTVYKRCQQISMQESALTHLIRHSIKAAHFFELTHAWCAGPRLPHRPLLVHALAQGTLDS